MATFSDILVIGSGQDVNLALEMYSQGFQGKLCYYSEFVDDVWGMSSGEGFDRFGIKSIEELAPVINSGALKNPLVVATNPDMSDMVMMLRAHEYLVFGTDSETRRLTDDFSFARKVASELPGMKIQESVYKESLQEIMESLLQMQDEGLWAVKDTDKRNSIAEGSPFEIIKDLRDLSEVQRNLRLGYLLERTVNGVQVGLASFFNGSQWLKPSFLFYDREFGGMIEADSREENETLDALTPLLSKNLFRGMLIIEYIVDENGNAYFQNFCTRFDRTPVKCLWKMLDNLIEVIEGTAGNKEVKPKVGIHSAVYVNAFANLEEKETFDFSDIGHVYEAEVADPSRFGITFDCVILDSNGSVAALPGDPRMFQMIGFGEDYFAATENLTEVYRACKATLEFEDAKQEAIEEIRDSNIFYHSWKDNVPKEKTASSERTCDYCGKEVAEEDSLWELWQPSFEEGKGKEVQVCDKCLADKAKTCKNCGKIEHVNTVGVIDDEYYCGMCYTDIMSEREKLSAMKTGGLCYERAYHYMMANYEPGMLLVHGIPEKPEPHGHAWIEFDGQVIDPSLDEDNPAVLPLELYYAIGGIMKTWKFDETETLKNTLRFKHYGPWAKEITR